MAALTRIEAPAVPLVTLAEVKEHLRVDNADEDQRLTDMAARAEAEVDGADGLLNRACVKQIWRWEADDFVARGKSRQAVVRLPLPPLMTITRIAYVDPGGVSRELDPSAYMAVTSREPGEVWPAYGTAWPDVRRQGPPAVTIEFECGFGPAAADVPRPIREWVLNRTGALYVLREGPSVPQVNAIGSWRFWQVPK